MPCSCAGNNPFRLPETTLTDMTDLPHTPPKAFALLGPTASGKTGLALALAQQLPLEIISLDSALVYRDMDIGTAKPSAAERAMVPHHLIDILSPLESYSAAQFVADCVRLVQDIHARGRWPLIVGGTMMYYQALTQGLNALPSADASVRSALQAQKQQYGLAHLYARLQQVDPHTAARLAAHDSQRIERALEIWQITGKPLSEHFAVQAAACPSLDLATVALIPAERRPLHAAIERRFKQMLDHGFLDEVRRLQAEYPGLHPDLPSMRCVGYRQAWAHLNGATDRPTFVAQGIAATRQLAKRQLTWLRKLAPDGGLDPYAVADPAATVLPLLHHHFQEPVA